jgi:phosphonate transport system substrate-binding protein
MVQRLASALVTLLLVGCEHREVEKPLVYETAPRGPTVVTYRFAVDPLHNPHKLAEAYQPLVDHLNERLSGTQLELEASRDYQAYEQKVRAREPAFLLSNPWQTLRAMKAGYHVFAMAGDAQDFKGLFIARKDGSIRKPTDLEGKTVSYPSPTAVAACILQQYFLHTHGVDVMTDIKNEYVGSQESSITHVLLGKSAAGATWLSPWRRFQKDHPADARQLEVLWETPPLINNSLMARDDLPAPLREDVRRLLLDLGSAPVGSAVLARMGIARFHAADDAAYDHARELFATFEREVRPIEQR